MDRHGSGAVGRGAATPENVFSHYGPVTGIACHPNQEFGNILLTSSFDRSIFGQKSFIYIISFRL